MKTKEINDLFRLFFSLMRSEYYFIEMLNAFITPGRGGYGQEVIGCSFASAFEEDWEEYFGETGVKLSASPPAVDEDVEIVVSNEEFLRRLEIEYLKFVETYPDRLTEVSPLFEKVKAKLLSEAK